MVKPISSNITVCGEPPTPGDNKDVSVQLVGNVLVATYTCSSEDYQFVGVDTLICGVSKSWNGTNDPGKCLLSKLSFSGLFTGPFILFVVDNKENYV